MFLLMAAGCSSGGGSSQEDTTQPPEDQVVQDESAPDTAVEPELKPDLADEVEEPKDLPMVLQYYPPSLCGCDPKVIPPKDCGWHVKDGTRIKVRAEHTAGKFEGAAGIYRVRLLFMGNPEKPEGVLVTEAKLPDETGVFWLEVNTIFAQDEEGVVKDGVYPFKILALSKNKDELGDPLEKSATLAIAVDTTGPKIQLVKPKVEDGKTLRFIETLETTMVAGDTLSGLKELHFYLGSTELEPSVTGMNGTTSSTPFARSLDISDFPTKNDVFKIVASDCVDNITEVEIPVQIIASPKYESAAHPQIDDNFAGAIKLNLADYDKEDGIDDLLAVTPTRVGLIRNGLDGVVQPIKPLFESEGLKDAQLTDVTGDGFDDLVVLSTDGEIDYLNVYAQRVNDEGQPTWSFPDEPIYSADLAGQATILKIRDMNVDGFPDIVLGGPSDYYSVAIFIHTRKSEENNIIQDYYTIPAVFTGVTGVTSIEFGYLDSDSYPDIVLGRGGEPTLSVVINDKNGKYGIAHDTVLHGGGTKLAVVGDFTEDGLDDVLVTGLTMGALYVERGNGLGYFNPLGPNLGQSDVDFGLEHVTNLVTMGLLNSGIRPLGDLLFIGEDPDSIALANFDEFPEKDIAVAVPESNRIGIYRYQPGSAGDFGEYYSVNPGLKPRSLVAGRFNGDNFNDLACLVGEGRVAVIHNRGAAGPGTFISPLEVPMPVQADWTKGRVVPLKFLAKNIDNFPGDDLVVVVDKQDQLLGESEIQAQMVLTWLSSGWFPTMPAIKSALNPDFEVVTGLAAGKLDTADQCMDLVLTLDEKGTTGCEARTIEVMRGCRKVQGAHTEEEALFGANADYFIPQASVQPGHFWSLGGFFGLQSPSGLALGKLNNDSMDDLVVFAAAVGEVENPEDFQPDIVATYLTRFDEDWLQNIGGFITCPQRYDQIWFECAPYWPIQQMSDAFCGASGGSELPKCVPVSGEGTCGPWYGPAKPSDQTLPWEVGIEPVSAIVGDFYPDGENCNDILVAWTNGSMSYLKGVCGPNAYKFHSTGLNPNLYAIGMNPQDLGASDIDKDGIVDVVAALGENISIMYGRDGGITFDPPKFLVQAGTDELQPSAVAVADVNDDGINDVIVSSKKQNQLAIYVGAGGREFLGPHYLPAGSSPIDLEVSDMDNDGCPDLAVLNAGSSTVTILRSIRCD